MDQYRDLGMREHLDRLAAEDDRGEAMAAMRGHDDKVTAFRLRGIDDRLVGMLLLDLDHLAWDAFRLHCAGDGAESFLGMLPYACLVTGRRVLEHLRVGRQHMKRRQDRQHGNVGADPFRQGDAVLNSLPRKFRPVRWYQDIGIHRPLSPCSAGRIREHVEDRTRWVDLSQNSARRHDKIFRLAAPFCGAQGSVLTQNHSHVTWPPSGDSKLDAFRARVGQWRS